MATPKGKLSGQVAIVTGGMQGFGQGIVETFLREEAVVLNVDLTVSTEGFVGSSKSTYNMKANVTSIDDWKKAIEICRSQFGSIPSIVVNNAGWTYSNKSTLEVTDEEFDKVFLVNVRPLYLSVQLLVPLLQKGGKGGSFIQISSTAALRPRPKLVWYNASKGAVSTASKGFALEFASDRIRFNCVCPVAGRSPLLSKFAGAKESGDPLTEEQLKQFNDSIPLGRLSEPKDVANAVLFLADPSSEFITGIDLPVDGGRCV